MFPLISTHKPDNRKLFRWIHVMINLQLDRKTEKCWVEVDLDAAIHNTRILREIAGADRQLMICLKADAYGHGLVPMAEAAIAGGADRLCVADVDEAVALRRADISCPIQILIQPPLSAVFDLYRYNLIPTLSSPGIVRRMADMLPGKLTVHVEVDTGMNRVNLKPENAVEFLNLVRSTGKFHVEGLFSHFSCSEAAHDPDAREFTKEQLKQFTKAVESCRAAGHPLPFIHMANTGAVINYPESYFDMIRPGFLVYGLPRDWIILPFKPVLSWKTRIQSLVKVDAGHGIGYERTYVVSHDTTLAAVACGYSDGYSHLLSGKSDMLVRGMRAKVVGRVGMNQTMIDVGDIPDAEIGDEVVLIGTQEGVSISATDLAKYIGMTPALVTSTISRKIPRLYVNVPDCVTC